MDGRGSFNQELAEIRRLVSSVGIANLPLTGGTLTGALIVAAVGGVSSTGNQAGAAPTLGAGGGGQWLWNYSNGDGEVDFVGRKGGGSGATLFRWYDWDGATMTQVMSLNRSGDLIVGRNATVTGTLLVSGAILTITGGQIAFPATQIASADANTLDDYEEGTWTPVVGGNASYSLQAGTYTKIGRLVYVQGALTINVLGTGSLTTISGLPFQSVTPGGTEMGGGVGYFSSIATNVVFLHPFVTSAVTTVGFRGLTAAAATETSPINVFQNGTRIDFWVLYEAAT